MFMDLERDSVRMSRSCQLWLASSRYATELAGKVTDAYWQRRVIAMTRNKSKKSSNMRGGAAAPSVVTSVKPETQATDDRCRDCTQLQAALKELYAQTSANVRAYMDLRFKHFTTFMVVTAFIGTATFRIDLFNSVRPLTACVGIVASCLFWLLDYRTSQQSDKAAESSGPVRSTAGHTVNRAVRAAGAYESQPCDQCHLLSNDCTVDSGTLGERSQEGSSEMSKMSLKLHV